MCHDCIQHSLIFNDLSTSCGKTKIFLCVNINMINISAGILLSLMVNSGYVTGRGQCVCKEPLVCTLLVCYTEVSRAYQEASMDTENVRSRNKSKKNL